jgi:transposase-like protein
VSEQVELSGLFANPRPTSFMQVIGSVVKVLDEGEAHKRSETARPKVRRKVHLSEAQKQDLVASYLLGTTTVELAVRYEIHYTTVSKYLKQRGVAIRLKSLREIEKVLAVDLYRSGLSVAKVADRIGCAPNTIRSELRAAGVQMRDTHGRNRACS